MRFSICIPVYNVEKYLAECLDSILNQTFRNFEIICINDGSTDGSRTILEDYFNKDKRIKIIDKQNQGLLWARRDAIKIAKGDYILFVDSDDKLSNDDVLEKLDIFINFSNSPDMILFDRIELCEGRNQKYCNHFFDKQMIFESENLAQIRYYFITRNYFNAMFLKCVKKNIIQNDCTDYSKFNPQMAEDISQSIFLFDSCKRIAYFPEFVYVYRINSDSITKSPLTFMKLKGQIYDLPFNTLLSYIGKWKLSAFFNDVYEKFYKKAYLFYADRLIELCNNRTNHNVVKNASKFNWFDTNTIFLKDKDILKKSKLKGYTLYLSLGLIKNSKYKIFLGLFLYNLRKAVKTRI